MCVSGFYTTFFLNISHSKKKCARYDHKLFIGLRVMYLIFLSDSTKVEFSRHIFEKYSTISFHENPSSGSWVVPCEHTYRRTNMTKQIVSFRNFENALKQYIKLQQFLKTRRILPRGYSSAVGRRGVGVRPWQQTRTLSATSRILRVCSVRCFTLRYCVSASRR